MTCICVTCVCVCGVAWLARQMTSLRQVVTVEMGPDMACVARVKTTA